MAKQTKKGSTKKTTKPTETKTSNTTHIIAILDRSGSMSTVKKDAIGGFNEFLKQQKTQKEKATMSVVLFDDEYTPLYEGKEIDIKDVKELTEQTFVPRGSTALYDAIGKSINSYKAKFETLKESERPDKVLVIIVTDGAENASREYVAPNQIQTLISDMKTKDWQFMFLCSTENAMTTGANLGVSRGNVFKFANTSAGNHELYSKVSAATASYRRVSKFSADFETLSNSLLDENNKKS